MKRLALLLALAAALAAPSARAATQGTIPGTAVHRHNGNWLGIQLTSNNFVVIFYDKNKKPMPADATGVMLTWTIPHSSGTYAPMLSDQLSPVTDISSEFTSGYSVPFPHKMTLRVVLSIPPAASGASDQGQTEVYTVRFPAGS